MKCKRETDGRRLDDGGKEAIRLRAVKMVVNGLSPEQVAKDLDINRRTIYGWLEKYHYGGLEALKRKPRPGAKPKLSAEQMAKLYRMVAWSDPRQYAFPFALWTLALVRELIGQRFDVSLSEVSVGRVLHTLGLTPVVQSTGARYRLNLLSAVNARGAFSLYGA